MAIAVGSTFFRSSAGTARVDPPGGMPAGLQAPFVVPNASPAGGDVFLYLMGTAEEVAAQFLARFDALRPSPVAALRVERGFERRDGREWFGYRDGVRNVAPQDRDGFVGTDPHDFPEEPAWTAGGTYVAYMNVRQNPQAADAVGPDGLDQALGRRRDGTRLDGQPGDPNLPAEPDDTSTLPPTSHVRKAGPRGRRPVMAPGPGMEARASVVAKMKLCLCGHQATRPVNGSDALERKTSAFSAP